ncbi:MAG: glycosidase [Spirochaetales bacterium]|nr:MAG: glycosidase [Spirochaetales bacterium]
MNVPTTRKSVRLMPDSTRVLARFFMPGQADRAASIMEKVAALSDSHVTQILEDVLRRFAPRHRNISKIFCSHFERVRELVAKNFVVPEGLSADKELLIGSYFTMEYSIESAAFYNPSITPDPYQGDLPPGHLRVIVSFRATGEGHLSSIVFRGAVLDGSNDIILDPVGNLVDLPETVKRHVYGKRDFLKKLTEMKVYKDVVAQVLDPLGETFGYGELRKSIAALGDRGQLSYSRRKVIESIEWLANSHYEVTFSRDTGLSERVIFPVSETESNGLEDARFIRFTDGDEVMYYATYTAYNGYAILPKLLGTEDFYHFKALPLHGQRAQNKGMSLFPRKVNGKFAMVGRCDGINLHILYSDDIHYWDESHPLESPLYPWEFVQIGNAGSPIETSEGWLLINHGVGPVRTYCLSASLLDLEDPTKVIGRLSEPILLPNAEEREGYVPNVVYSCGSILHDNELIIPYAMADYASSFVTVPVDRLLAELLKSG